VIVLVAFVSVLLLAVALDRVGVVRIATAAMGTAQGAVGVMQDSSLDDRAREQAMQRASIRLLGHLVSIVVRAAIALVVSLIPIAIADRSGLASATSVIAFLSRLDVIAIASVAVIGGYLIRIRLWPSN
jgi:hypothetical protein